MTSYCAVCGGPVALGETTCGSCSTVAVPLTRGYVALVDVADYSIIAGRRWYATNETHDNGRPRTVYARSGGGTRGVLMHRLILGLPKGCRLQTDHINGVGTDNRRANLRICEQWQNQGNASVRGGQSRYRGVYRKSWGWAAGINTNGRGSKKHFLGVHATEEDAARAYDRAAVEKWGSFAKLNLPIVREVP